MRATRVESPAVVLAFAVACPFVCHSAAQRRHLLFASDYTARRRNPLLAIAIAYHPSKTVSSETRNTSPHPIEWNLKNLTGIAPPQHPTIPSDNFEGESIALACPWKYPPNSQRMNTLHQYDGDETAPAPT